MLGTRLKSWMEAHIVRARKKQNRKGKNDKSSVTSNPQDEASDSKTGSSSLRKDSSAYSVGDGAPGRPSMTSDTSKVNLSSPESAYSTGYSTDGTSPGASIPPEYYINLRTGKHYVQASTGNSGVGGAETGPPVRGQPAPAPAPPVSPRPAAALTPSSARRRREEALKRKLTGGALPESSTEEDIAKPAPPLKILTPKGQRKSTHGVLSHRRTESYDESSQRYRVSVPIYSVIDRDSEGSSSTRTTGGSSSFHSNISNNNNSTTSNNNNSSNNNYARPNCTSPYLSSATASPRQRNRIRTNPWLGASPGSAPLAAPENESAPTKIYSSQGETSSTVGSNSTLSSTGRVDLGVGKTATSSPRASSRPPPADLIRIVRSGTFLASPLVNGRRGVMDTVTTCSPQPNRPCRHSRTVQRYNSTLSTSSSSTPSSEDDVTTNSVSRRQPVRNGASPFPSDLSEDDLTLNEMGKYDESYVYEKETDILSDSAPTDCDDPRHDHSDTSSCVEVQPYRGRDEIDFIDTGSYAELDTSHDIGSGKLVNRGHCIYMGGLGTPESSVTGRRRSRARRQRSDERGSNSGSQVSRNASQPGSAVSTPTKRCRRRRSARVAQDEGLAEVVSPVLNRAHARGRSPNLNRLLVDKLMTGCRVPSPLGSRSADCTPISLRKHSSLHHHHHHHHHHHNHKHQHELNGKVLKNPHVSKLISGSNCPSPAMEPKCIAVDTHSPILLKKRSNSVSIGGSLNYYLGAQSAPPRPVDNDGDLKYRRLIREAETLLYAEQQQLLSKHPKTPPSALSPFHKTGYSPRNLGKPVPVPTLPPPPTVPYTERPIESPSRTLQSKTAPRTNSTNEEGNFLKTISKTLERMMIRNGKDKKSKTLAVVDNSLNPERYQNNNPPVSPLSYQTLRGLQGDEESYISVTVPPASALRHLDEANHNDEPRDTNDNLFLPGPPTFTSFGRGRGGPPQRRPNRKLELTLWREGQLSSPNKLTRRDEAVSTPKTPLIPFEAFDLVGRPCEGAHGGAAAPATSPLPQSEPVKRKVYACSSTFDRLQKSLMFRPDADSLPGDLAEQKVVATDVDGMSTEALRDENWSLKEKVEQLRRRRLEVEERVRTTQAAIDRLRAADTAAARPRYQS